MKSLCLVSLAVLFLATGASAQQGSSELRGVVLDGQNAVLPGVSLTIRNQDTGIFREAVSNADGTYFVTGLVPGIYEVRASLAGFREHVRPDVRLEVGKTATVDVTLEVGRLEEAVTVTAETPLLDVTSKEIGGHITGRELTDLPSVNRNFIGFVGLLPGIVPNISTESFGSDAVVVNGTDSRNNNFLVDGANNNDDVIGQRAGTQARTPIEAIQEFQVLTHQFDAEFGRTTGAVINAITKQGTNRFSGSAFSFFQDAALTEKDYFAKQNNLAKPDTKQTQWGGTVGGPIVRDKAHFFFSLERVMIDRGTTVNIPARPEFNTAATTQDRVWNTMLRFDQQLNANHTYGVRWLRESSPQRNQLIPVLGRQSTTNAAREESDVDQTTVGTLTSVLSNSRLNTVRFAFTRENVAFANPGFNGNGRSQMDLEPTLQYLTFIDQQSEVASARINNAFSLDDTYSWFIPGKRGDHDLKFGVQYQVLDQRQHRSRLHERAVRVPWQREFQCGRSANVSGAAADSCAWTAGVLHEDAFWVGLCARQVEAERSADADTRHALRHRGRPTARAGQSEVSRPQRLPGGQEQLRPAPRLRLQSRGSSIGRARGLRAVL